MHEKKIHISAIIPEELYIKRDADRKLKEAVQRMSKPAYISVARQMGKTNLLINLKRELENEEIRLAYIDMTNKFNSAQDCFRYIIDTTIEANENIEAFQIAEKTILENRENYTKSAVREYESELKTILKYHKGKIVIILDEVDALTNLEFSDEIFAQIRKLYFSQVTTPAFNRITYTLSGVIDPKKLIKNKNNSPFNIAIPIKINDFTEKEFNNFLNLSEIPINNQIKNKFYDWCKGNPRMTFDIMSELEDIYIETEKLEIGDLEKVIKSLYLTNFNHPPIDHIRDLVKHNTDVRKAIINLKNERIEDLSDDIIHKLYLFGITASRTDTEKLKIKNKIIEKSLSDEWINKIEIEKKGYFDLAKEYKEQGRLRDAIEYYKEYIENEPKGSLKNLATYNIGEIFHKLKEFEKSNEYLLQFPISKDVSYEMYMWQKLYTGLNFIKLDESEKSIQYLDEIIEEKKNDQTYVNALLNKGEVLLSIGDIKSFEKIIEHYNNLIEAVNNYVDNLSETDKILTVAYYRLGFVYLAKKEKKQAKENLEKALNYAENYQKPLLYLNIDSCLDDKIEKKRLYKELANFIIENNVTLAPDKEIINFNDIQVLVILVNLFEHKDNFEPFFNYAINNLYSNKKDYELMYETAVLAVNSGEKSTSLKLLYEIGGKDGVSNQILKNTYQIIGLIDNEDRKKSFSYLIKFARLFDENDNFKQSLQVIDFNSFISIIDYYRKDNKIEQSYKYAKIIEKHINNNLNTDLKTSAISIYFELMDYHQFKGDFVDANNYANTILKLIGEVKPTLNELSDIDKKWIKDVEKQTNSLLYKNDPLKRRIPTINSNRKIGRNELVKVKYKNGNISTTKYKKVIDEIDKGECVIVD